MRPSTTRLKRYKAPVACVSCRRRKLKCDAARPVCGRCQKSNRLRDHCTYVSRDNIPDMGSGFISGTANTEPLMSLSPRSHLLRPDEVNARGSAEFEAAQGNVGSIDFIDRIQAAIDAKTGVSPAGRRYAIPMVDAPMFHCSLNTYARRSNQQHAVDLLPPRRQADHLLNLYWLHVEPLALLLDQHIFNQRYEALFSGQEIEFNEVIFKATLNVIFALSTQVQESISAVDRGVKSDAFFRRAWSLLHSDLLIWSSPSLELVQCLVLFAFYLQCTEHLHQTWMIIGTAIRIGLSIGLNTPQAEKLGLSVREKWFRRLAWEKCIYLERTVSWTLGRTYSLPPIAVCATRGMVQRHVEISFLLGSIPPDCYVKLCEIDELTTEIMASHLKISAVSRERQRINEIDINVLLRFDQRLNELEKALPKNLALEVDDDGPNLRRQRILIHMRLAHMRQLLYRPLFIRFCVAQHRPDNNNLVSEQDFSEQILELGATRSLTSSRRMVDLACNCCGQVCEIGILPWWLRVFYLSIAAQNIVAASLQSDVFSKTVSESFAKAMSALRAHEYIVPCIEDCNNVLEKMWQNATHMRPPIAGGDNGMSEIWNQTFDDFFQQFGAEGEYPIFDMEKIDWN